MLKERSNYLLKLRIEEDHDKNGVESRVRAACGTTSPYNTLRSTLTTIAEEWPSSHRKAIKLHSKARTLSFTRRHRKLAMVPPLSNRF